MTKEQIDKAKKALAGAWFKVSECGIYSTRGVLLDVEPSHAPSIGERIADKAYEVRDDSGCTSIRMVGTHQFCWHSGDKELMGLRLTELQNQTAALCNEAAAEMHRRVRECIDKYFSDSNTTYRGVDLKSDLAALLPEEKR